MPALWIGISLYRVQGVSSVSCSRTRQSMASIAPAAYRVPVPESAAERQGHGEGCCCRWAGDDGVHGVPEAARHRCGAVPPPSPKVPGMPHGTVHPPPLPRARASPQSN